MENWSLERWFNFRSNSKLVVGMALLFQWLDSKLTLSSLFTKGLCRVRGGRVPTEANRLPVSAQHCPPLCLPHPEVAKPGLQRCMTFPVGTRQSWAGKGPGSHLSLDVCPFVPQIVCKVFVIHRIVNCSMSSSGLPKFLLVQVILDCRETEAIILFLLLWITCVSKMPCGLRLQTLFWFYRATVNFLSQHRQQNSVLWSFIVLA